MVPRVAEPGSPSASQMLMSAEKHAPNSYLWVESESEVWTLVKVVSQENTLLNVVNGDGQKLEVDLGFGEVYPQNPKVVADMTALFHIHEPGILHNLRERAKLDGQKPYNFMGTILICVNPLRKIVDPPMEDFVNKPLDPETPHPYAIAELAYHQMKLGSGGNTNQSIVVSGESGAGKTETSKIMLKYLAQRSVGGVAGLDSRIIESSPILESFGNAKTLRNPNSSRFGKFLKLQFSVGAASLAGGFIETYLLEKSRVLSQGQGERNFHVLYELVAGASADMKKKLALTRAEDYKVLSQSNCITLEGVDDAANFRNVVQAFDTIGMSKELQDQVWGILACVLHMASMDFTAEDTPEGEIAHINPDVQQRIATLLGIDSDAVAHLLTRRVMSARGETFTKRIDRDSARYARDASAKALYECVFLWVVKTVSDSLGKGADALPFIGVLDIFGFENFARNELEQLLINFTNESLQDTFNKQVFNNELKLYEDEGIEVVVSSCPDNSECIELLSGRLGAASRAGKPLAFNGVITMLDVMCREPDPSDVRYCTALHTAHSRNQHFPAVHKKDARDSFMIKHYAGRVTYSVDGWISRNNDRIPEAFQGVLNASTLAAVRGAADAVAAKGAASAANAAASAAGGSHNRAKSMGTASKSKVLPTVAKGFMESMTELSRVLDKTTCSFIRCIKPNFAMKLGEFDNRYVVDQLQCLGILQTCEVLKVGMPTRVTYAELKDVLKSHAAEAAALFAGEPETALISAILWAFEVPSEAFRLGKTRVFFRAGQISTLERILRDTSTERGAWILQRLQQALENRKIAKVAAEAAQQLMNDIETVVETAKAAASSATSGPSSKAQVSDAEIHELQQVLKGTLKADYTDQIAAVLQAAREDRLGTHAPDALLQVKTAANTASTASTATKEGADTLESAIAAARGGDGDRLITKLNEDIAALDSMKASMKAATEASIDAANKCQVEKAKAKADEAKALSTAITSGAATAHTHCSAAADAATAKRAAAAAASAAAADCAALSAASTAAWTTMKDVLAQAEATEEAAATQAQIAAAAALALAAAKKKEEEAREAATVQAGLEAAKALQSAAAVITEAEVLAQAESAHKKRQSFHDTEGIRFLNHGKKRNSVKDLLADEAVKAAEAEAEAAAKQVSPADERSVEPQTRPRMSMQRKPSVADMGIDVGSSTAQKGSVTPTSLPPTATTSPLLTGSEDGSSTEMREDLQQQQRRQVVPGGASKTFMALFEEAIEGGKLEGHLMKQSKYFNRWKSRFCVLEGGFLDYYDKKSYVGTKKKKSMELEPSTITSYTNTKNCFCVRTGEEVWFLLAKDEDIMTRWMTAINAQVHALYLKTYTPPADNYWGKTRPPRVRAFFRMVPDAMPQWIRAYPEVDAPRTGDGLFPGEIIEVIQMLSAQDNSGAVFLRLADERGWTFARHPQSETPLFEEIRGDIADDHKTYGFPASALEPVPILFGPGLESQQTGDCLEPGQKAVACERYTPDDGSGVVFIKLADGRGWVPVKKKTSETGSANSSSMSSTTHHL